MNLTLKEAYTKTKQLDSRNYSAQLLLAPPAPYLAHFTQNFKNIEFCAQDLSAFNGYGAYTGEYSAEMIKSCNINYAAAPCFCMVLVPTTADREANPSSSSSRPS